MPVDPMDDVELRSVQLQFPHSRGSIEGSCDIRRVPTDKGDLTVAVQGDTRKPAILTYHDLGLNCEFSTEENDQFIYIIHAFFLPPSDVTSFAGFFNYPSMRNLLDNFCVYHVNAPGQEEGAPAFPEE